VIREIPYRFFLTDDDSLFRLSIRNFLDTEAAYSVVGESGDGAGLLDFLKTHPMSLPDMAILDISMPGRGGIDAASAIKNSYPMVKVLILTIHNETEYLHKALSIGVDGYLLKEDADAELFPAIEKISRGGIYVSRHLKKSIGGRT
jgi:two-component system, NarL family, response regulator DegU